MRIEDLPIRLQEQARAQMEEKSSSAESAPLATKPTKHEVALEKDLQRQCELELSRRNIAFLHISMRAREKKGWPDLVFCLGGRPMAVELKSASGRLSDEQLEMLANMHADKWETYVMHDLALFIDLLNGHQVLQWGDTK